jgi:hypothetical protein
MTKGADGGGGSRWEGAPSSTLNPACIHPTPYTLIYTICRKSNTLLPTICTLHPTLYNLYPTPYALHPTPYTLHPKFYTLHPAP